MHTPISTIPSLPLITAIHLSRAQQNAHTVTSSYAADAVALAFLQTTDAMVPKLHIMAEVHLGWHFEDTVIRGAVNLVLESSVSTIIVN